MCFFFLNMLVNPEWSSIELQRILGFLPVFVGDVFIVNKL